MNHTKVLNMGYVSLAFLGVGAIGFIGGLFTSQNISESEYEKWQLDRHNQRLNNLFNEKVKKYDKLVTNS